MGVFGDIIYALPTIAALGSGHMYYYNRPWSAPLLPKIHNLLPLLEIQPNISGVSQHTGEWITHDLSTYRAGGLNYGDTIIERQARWLRVDVSSIIKTPWLTVDRIDSIAPIVISRGPRWQGFFFPWIELVRDHIDDMVFLGTHEDYGIFVKQFGHAVPWYPTKDLLEMARVIAGAELFIGSQSCPLAIAEGLHNRTIVEVCPWALDCMHIRHGNIHVIGGTLRFMWRGTEYSYPSFHKGASLEQVTLLDRANVRYQQLLHLHN